MLRKILTMILIGWATFAFVMHDAQAKRFGGGKSFGFSRPANHFSKSANGIGQTAANRSALGQAATAKRNWLGPLAGLAVGGILASLLMGHGLGTGILTWLIVGAVVFLLIGLIRAKKKPVVVDAQNNTSFFQGTDSVFTNQPQPMQANVTHSLAVDAETENTFLREAKLQFMRLQAAYDQKNIDDLSAFTMPEVSAEIQMQWQERGQQENKTLVLSLFAELLGMEQDDRFSYSATQQARIASVRFTGLIQENPAEPAKSLNEIWHFKQENLSARWLVAGIQQENGSY